MKTFKLFTYGTLQTRWLDGKPAELVDYTKVSHPAWVRAGKPNTIMTVVPSPGVTVSGVLHVRPMSEGAWIDRYESDYFKRVKLNVKVGTETVIAWVYVATTEEERQAVWRKKHGLEGKNGDGWITLDEMTGKRD